MFKRAREFAVAIGGIVNSKPTVLNVDIEETCALNEAASVLLNSARFLKRMAVHSVRTNEEGAKVLILANLLTEEVGELLQAMAQSHDLSDILSEATDVRYSIQSIFVAYGLEAVADEAEKRIHDANMSKLIDGKPQLDSSGRVVKPDDFVPACLQSLIEVETA